MSMTDYSIKIEEEDIFIYLIYKGRSTYIKVCFENNSDEDYLLNMLKETISDTIGDVDIETCLFYWDDALLFEPDIISLIRTKRGCGNFKITIKDGNNSVEDSDSGIDQRTFDEAVVSSSKLRVSFEEEPVSKKLLHTTDPTEPSTRKSIIHHACQFIFKECGPYPNNSQKSALISALMELFPGLRCQEKFVVKWFQMKLKNYRRKIKSDDKGGKRKGSSVDPKVKRIQDQVDFLKTCDGDDDVEKIKQALRDTLRYRIDHSARDDWNIYSNYKILSSNLELMAYDFQLRFPRKDQDIATQIESFTDASSTIYRVETKQFMPEPDCLADIRKLCCIFNYTKTPTGNKEPTFTISRMLEDLIQFSTGDDDSKVLIKSHSHPILFAQGTSKKAIDKYFIKIEDTFLELPLSIKFFEAFDYLIQSFYVFNFEFPRSLSVFYNFIVMNIYEIEAKSKYDQKKPKIDDLHLRPKDFLHKVQQYLKGN